MCHVNSTSTHRELGRSTKPPTVTRAFLEVGGMAAIYMRDAPGLQLSTEGERAESIAATLAMRPDGDVRVFGYGSLIWNPALKFVERRDARVEGWHRSFCMSIIAGRASPSSPGLMLGLDQGGHCLGSAFRVDEADLASELTLLWRREMLCRGAYIPRWLKLIGEDGLAFGHAIAFTINPRGEKYVAGMPIDSVVDRIATASGGIGSCANYLFQTRDGLRACGISDTALETLAIRVEAALMSDKVGLAA